MKRATVILRVHFDFHDDESYARQLVEVLDNAREYATAEIVEVTTEDIEP